MKLLLPILSVFAFTVSLLPSCTLKSEYPADIEIPTSISLSVGETYDLGLESSSWSSKNDFVAQIGTDGVVTAKHVGKCTVMFSNFRQTLRCEVTVFPNTTLYSEPIQQWGMRKSQLISIEGHDYKESDNSIGYMTDNSSAPMKIYAFEDDRLFASGVVVKISSSERLADHLLERYQPVALEGTRSLFIDSYSLDEAETVVYMEVYSLEYWAVMYMDIDYFNSMNSTKSEAPEDLFGYLRGLLK